MTKNQKIRNIDLAKKEILDTLKKYNCLLTGDDRDNILLRDKNNVMGLGRPTVGCIKK
jgi:hypothetical protein